MVIARVPVDITWSGATGSPGVNVWHARWDGDLAGSAQMAGLLEDLETFYTAIRGLYPAQVAISFNGEIGGLGPDVGDTATYDPWTVAGNAGGNFLPPEVQALVSWKTGSGGRRGRGRTFLGPIATSAVNGAGALTGETTGVILAAANALIGESEDPGNGAWGVYSRLDDVVRDFVNATVPGKTSVLRSRRD